MLRPLSGAPRARCLRKKPNHPPSKNRRHFPGGICPRSPGLPSTIQDWPAGHSADPAPFPHQAAAVDLQRIGHRDTKQRRSPQGRRTARTSQETISIRGLNRNCNHDLKNLFKGAAIVASSKPGPLQEFYTALLAKGIRPEMARLTLARKIATIVLIVWKRGVSFDAQYLKPQTA